MNIKNQLSEMIKQLLAALFLILLPLLAFSQYPPLGLNAGSLTTGPGGTVDVPITAGANWSNITQVACTFTFDPTKITFNSMQNWGLSNPSGAIFGSSTPGVVTFTWTSLITIGPSLPAGGLVFNLRFNVIGAIGDTSPVTITNTPQNHTWSNGFGWGGSNFTLTQGQVAIACIVPTAAFTSTPTYFNYQFNNTGTYGTTYAWDFGDGNTSAAASPSHTYATAGMYTVCLISSSVCGADTACSTVNVCPNPPQANFSSSPNQLTVAFTNSSLYAPVAWAWDFGDGNTSTLQSPSHTYAANGTYTVCMIASNGCGADTICQPVAVTCVSPTAGFSNSSNGLAADFTSTSTGMPTSWSWDFGDGTTSTSQNPSHNYLTQGTYNVCLTTTNVCGTNTICQNVTIFCPTPTAGWANNSAGLIATFTDFTSNTPTAWNWNFGDGTTSNQQNPVHAFPSGGTYNVCLITTNQCGADTLCQNVLITCPTPTAAFSNSVSGLDATFTNTTSGTTTSWSWDFGDGTTSTMQNPTHTYTTGGTFNVCFIATNACGNDTVCNTITTVCQAPTAAFSSFVTMFSAAFTNTTTGTPTSWFWDFGDGNTNTVQNPTHVYSGNGTYNVCLTASIGCDSTTTCSNVLIDVIGLDELSFNQLNIAPNPANDYYSINSTFGGNMIVKMYNLQGKSMTEFDTKNEEKISLREWQSGSYFLVIDMNGTLVSKKLIIE